MVDEALLKLDLRDYADKPAGTYSGGNRRKLSTEEDFGVLVYKLPTNLVLKLSQVYSSLEQIRENLCYSTSSFIEDYSLSQTTLDDVFIHFARQQSEKEGILDAGGAKSITEGRKREDGGGREGRERGGLWRTHKSRKIKKSLAQLTKSRLFCQILSLRQDKR